jgi:hypothetical protein
MIYRRSIEGAQDARVLAELFRRLRVSLVRDGDGVVSFARAGLGVDCPRVENAGNVGRRSRTGLISVPADCQPDGESAAATQRSAQLTAAGVGRSLPSRTAGGAVFFCNSEPWPVGHS